MSTPMAMRLEKPVDLEVLMTKIRASWTKDTSHDPSTWCPSRPSAGQCWTSATVIRQFFGGEIVFAEVLPLTDPIERHAWNVLPDGTTIDLTRDQFAAEQAFRICVVPEPMIRAVCGSQAALLLERVRRALVIDEGRPPAASDSSFQHAASTPPT